MAESQGKKISDMKSGGKVIEDMLSLIGDAGPQDPEEESNKGALGGFLDILKAK